MTFGNEAIRHSSLAAYVDLLEQPIRRESLHVRFTNEAVAFMKTCLLTILARETRQRPLHNEILKPFSRVMLFDSSSWDINPKLRELFGGSGGMASAANCKMQLGYDYRNGTISLCDVTPGIRPDNAYTKVLPNYIQEGDLVIFDLGYFALETFQAIQTKDASYLSRFKTNTKVYDRLTKNEIDLSKKLSSTSLDYLDFSVTIGARVRFPCRMIAMRVSDEVAQKRRRKLRREARKKGYQVRKSSLVLAGWTIMITNVDEAIITAEEVWHLYAIRWQIELLFKQLKSVLQIHRSNTANGSRLLCEIYGTLMVAIFVSSIHSSVNSYLWNEGKRELSFNKLAKRIQERSFYIVQLLYRSLRTIVKSFIEEIDKIIRNCVKAIQRKRLTSLERLELIVVKRKSGTLAAA